MKRRDVSFLSVVHALLGGRVVFELPFDFWWTFDEILRRLYDDEKRTGTSFSVGVFHCSGLVPRRLPRIQREPIIWGFARNCPHFSGAPCHAHILTSVQLWAAFNIITLLFISSAVFDNFSMRRPISKTLEASPLSLQSLIDWFIEVKSSFNELVIRKSSFFHG